MAPHCPRMGGPQIQRLTSSQGHAATRATGCSPRLGSFLMKTNLRGGYLGRIRFWGEVNFCFSLWDYTSPCANMNLGH